MPWVNQIRQCHNCQDKGHVAGECHRKGKGKGGKQGGEKEAAAGFTGQFGLHRVASPKEKNKGPTGGCLICGELQCAAN